MSAGEFTEADRKRVACEAVIADDDEDVFLARSLRAALAELDRQAARIAALERERDALRRAARDVVEVLERFRERWPRYPVSVTQRDLSHTIDALRAHLPDTQGSPGRALTPEPTAERGDTPGASVPGGDGGES